MTTGYIVQALRDYDYMNACSLRQKDPFLVTSERRGDKIVLDRIMQNLLVDEKNDKDIKPIPRFMTTTWEKDKHGHHEPIGGTRRENSKASYLQSVKWRFAMALLAGFFLIGPMWLIVLHNTRYTALISTTVLVIVFGFLMAVFQTDYKDVLSTTAAYAAILIVFVGVYLTPSKT
jgi:hypothetical protein